MLCQVTLAQEKFTISGYIEDAKTGEKLIGANIYDAKTFKGTTSNAYGFYSLTLPSDSVDLVISFIGYNKISERIKLDANREQNFALGADVLLDEVEITAEEASEQIHEKSQMSSVSIPMSQIKSLPAFLGEVDVIKALQLLPGVQSGSEASSGLYVRGGGPDQNLILLDGVPVYNASHLFGFFSVFNADAINSVELIKGGFPARYGGRLSSVVDIRMKEGNTKKFGASLSVGLISSKLTLEGPIIKDKTSFIISGRRTYIDLLARPFILAASEGEGIGGYFFHDFNAKVNHKFSEKDRLYLSTYTGRDKFYFNQKEKDGELSNQYKASLGWGNWTGMMRWNHVFTPKLFGNLTATYSSYDLATDLEYEESDLDDEGNVVKDRFKAGYESGIEDWGAKLDFDYSPTPSQFIRFGAGATQHTFSPGARQFKLTSDEETELSLDTIIADNEVKALEIDAYIEDDIKLGSRLKVNAGLHFSGFKVDDAFYKSVQPRLSARFLVSPQLSLKASYAEMQQFIHLLSNSSALDLPSDLWVPATAKVKPQKSRQVAAGVAQTLFDKYELSVEGYYKTMDNLIAYLDGASYFDGSKDWQDKVASGSGEAYGLEFLFQKKTGKTTGWLGYTLSWSNRQFDERINNGEPFPYKYDRRHDIAIALIHRFSDRIELSANWVFGTGNAVTLPIARYPRAELANEENGWINAFGYGDVKHFDSRNGYRMRNYHRLDWGLSFFKKKKRGERRWNLGFYNLYSRKNPFFIFEDQQYYSDGQGNGRFRRVYKQVSIFPILPSFSYNRSW